MSFGKTAVNHTYSFSAGVNPITEHHMEDQGESESGDNLDIGDPSKGLLPNSLDQANETAIFGNDKMNHSVSFGVFGPQKGASITDNLIKRNILSKKVMTITKETSLDERGTSTLGRV